MKKMFLAIAIVSALFTSCKSGGGDPKSVLKSFFEALSKKDVAAARKLATADSKSMLDMMEMGLKMAKDSKENKEFDKYDKMEIGDAKIDGDKATVSVKEKESGEATNFILKKESGDWKVAFDKASMMQMGMEKMNEKGTDDKINESLDKLKDINPDSLAGKLKEAGKEIDKLKDAMEKKEN